LEFVLILLWIPLIEKKCGHEPFPFIMAAPTAKTFTMANSPVEEDMHNVQLQAQRREEHY
jgi:hypothetical protein